MRAELGKGEAQALLDGVALLLAEFHGFAPVGEHGPLLLVVIGHVALLIDLVRGGLHDRRGLGLLAGLVLDALASRGTLRAALPAQLGQCIGIAVACTLGQIGAVLVGRLHPIAGLQGVTLAGNGLA